MSGREKKASANTFLTTVAARLQLHTAAHDRRRALPVTQIKLHQNAERRGGKKGKREKEKKIKVELQRGSGGFISH